MDIPNGMSRTLKVNTVQEQKTKADPKESRESKQLDNHSEAVTHDIHSEAVTHDIHSDNVNHDKHSEVIADGNQLQTRNISFKMNKASKEMYVEITNEDNEVIRTIPADEDDPTFIELLQQAQPGSIINKKG